MISNTTASSFEVLLSCMYQEGFEIAYKSKINSDLLIINQCDRNGYEEKVVDGHLWRMISTTERGVSKSRNMALKNAHGDICLLADDDQTFIDDYSNIICDAFSRLKDAAVVAFNVERVNVSTKKSYYVITEERETSPYRNFGNPNIAFRKDVIQKNGVQFDENFGSGSEWGGGEDTLFQRCIREKGLRIFESPGYITSIDYGSGSRWFHGYTKEYFYNQGAFAEYCKSPKFKRELYYIYYSFVKYRRERELSPFSKFIWYHRGEKGWKKGITYHEYISSKEFS